CCSLADGAVADPARVAKLARSALDARPASASYADTLVLALYRAGDPAAALRAHAALRASDRPPNPVMDLYQCYYLALIHHRLGSADEARRWLDRAARA